MAKEEQHQITEANVLDYKKKNIQYISMSRVKYLTPVDVDNLLEALKLSGKQIRRDDFIDDQSRRLG